jgi:hypothetical protein
MHSHKTIVDGINAASRREMKEKWKGNGHASKSDPGAGAPGQTRREIAEHAGRRVRSRRDTPHSRGQARRSVGEAGNRDRPVESPPCRREARPPAGLGDGADETERGVSDACIASSAETVGPPIAGEHARVEAQTAQCRFEEGAVTPCQDRGSPAIGSVPEGIRAKGGSYQGL